VPPNKVIVETTFLAFVPSGNAAGITVELLALKLRNVFGVLLPQLLVDVLESNEMVVQKLLRRLQDSNKDDIAILNPFTVDVVEFGK
jgi:hypothetical protein